MHAAKTASRWSNPILDDWDRWREKFWQIVPKEMLTRLEHPLDDAEAAKMVAAE